MAILRSNPPAYRGKVPPTAGSSGLLSGLWCYLFGGGARPAYRSHHGGGTAPTVSRCWWSFQDRPQYKTPPAPAPEPGEPTPSEPVPDQGPSECGDGVPVIGRAAEIHIYPAE